MHRECEVVGTQGSLNFSMDVVLPFRENIARITKRMKTIKVTKDGSPENPCFALHVYWSIVLQKFHPPTSSGSGTTTHTDVKRPKKATYLKKKESKQRD